MHNLKLSSKTHYRVHFQRQHSADDENRYTKIPKCTIRAIHILMCDIFQGSFFFHLDLFLFWCIYFSYLLVCLRSFFPFSWCMSVWMYIFVVTRPYTRRAHHTQMRDAQDVKCFAFWPRWMGNEESIGCSLVIVLY